MPATRPKPRPLTTRQIANLAMSRQRLPTGFMSVDTRYSERSRRLSDRFYDGRTAQLPTVGDHHASYPARQGRCFPRAPSRTASLYHRQRLGRLIDAHPGRFRFFGHRHIELGIGQRLRQTRPRDYSRAGAGARVRSSTPRISPSRRISRADSGRGPREVAETYRQAAAVRLVGATIEDVPPRTREGPAAARYR